MTVRTMQAPARMTSARFGCNPTIRRRSSTVRVRYKLDLPLDLGAIEHGALHDVQLVRRRAMTHSCEIRDGAADRDERVRFRPPIEAREIGSDCTESSGQDVLRDRAAEPEPVGKASRADVHAEALVDTLSETERELRAAATGVEDD